MEAIAENGLDNHIYVVPMVVDTTNIRQVKISLEPAFKKLKGCKAPYFSTFSALYRIWLSSARRRAARESHLNTVNAS